MRGGSVLLSRHGLVLESAEDQGFPINDPSLFSDNNHLSSKGRDEFTLRIAVEIKSWLAGERVGTP
jgi:hypothetical protein